MFEMILDHLDVHSIFQVERFCTQLRALVVETSVYRRRFVVISSRTLQRRGLGEQREVSGFREEENSQLECSKQYLSIFEEVICWWN